jgi:cellobiose-specific phosphotransferase system component IIA
MNKELEQYCFGMISSAGEARSLVFGALQQAKEGNFIEARKMIEESRKVGVEAHKIQMKLLTLEARGEAPGASVLLVHAQDLLMASTSERDLGEYIIDLLERTNK